MLLGGVLTIFHGLRWLFVLSAVIVSEYQPATEQAAYINVLDSFSSRQAIDDVRSFSGHADVTKDVQTAVNSAFANNRGLFFPAGLYNIASGHLSVPAGVQIFGEGWTEFPSNRGTIVRFSFQAATDPYGFYITGSGAQIRNLEIDEPQKLAATCDFFGTLAAGSSTITDVAYPNGCRPVNGDMLNAPNLSYGTMIASGAGGSAIAMAPPKGGTSAKALAGALHVGVTASGSFTPSVGPWAIYTAGPAGSRLTVDHVMLRNVYDGIGLVQARGGYLNDIFGQPLHQGILVDGDSDVAHLSNVHLGWTYWTGNPGVLAWQHANAVSYSFGRVDNPQVINLFSFNARIGIRFFQRLIVGDPNGLDGETSLGEFVNVGLDNVAEAGVSFEGAPSVKFANLYVYPDVNISGSKCLQDEGTHAAREFDLDIANGDCLTANTYAMSFSDREATRPALAHLTNFRIHAWSGRGTGERAMRLGRNVTVLANVNPAENGAAYPDLVEGDGRLWYPGKGQTSDCPCWREDEDGTLTEWGITTPSAGVAVVNFPYAFHRGVTALQANPIINNPALTVIESVMVGAPSLTSVKLYPRFNNGAVTGAAAENVTWTAIGK